VEVTIHVIFTWAQPPLPKVYTVAEPHTGQTDTGGLDVMVEIKSYAYLWSGPQSLHSAVDKTPRHEERINSRKN